MSCDFAASYTLCAPFRFAGTRQFNCEVAQFPVKRHRPA
jgi:hypothetical protein